MNIYGVYQYIVENIIGNKESKATEIYHLMNGEWHYIGRSFHHERMEDAIEFIKIKKKYQICGLFYKLPYYEEQIPIFPYKEGDIREDNLIL